MVESEPQSFKYYGVDVYNLDELVLFDQAYFYGCLKRKRDILIKKKITYNDYYYAKNTKRGWEESHKNYNKAKILIKSNWVRSNVTKFLRESKPSEVPEKSPSFNIETRLLQAAPPILELKEHEKFRDDTDNVFEVEVRGFRENSQIYFKALDIQKLFEMDNLVRRLKQTNYEREEDYILFLVDKPLVHGAFEAKRICRTFVTYSGLLKLIFRSKSKTAHRFRKWATRVIYTAHVGTEEQRFEQALDIGRVNSTNLLTTYDFIEP